VNPYSLRVRLLLGAAAAVFGALVVAWVVLSLLFERHLERQVEADLRRNALELIGELTLDPNGRPHAQRQPSDSRFIETASGRYWQLSTTHGTLRSRSLWNGALPGAPRAPTADWARRVIDGPFGQRLLVIERVIRLEKGSPPVTVQLAQDEKSIQLARLAFSRELALSLVLLWLFLAAAAWVQVRLGLAPLGRIREDLQRLRTSPSERLAGRHHSEIEPLVAAINALAAAREQDLETARHRAADLAHGLKTPLAALSAQSRRAREAGAAEAADGLDRAIAAASAAVEAELTRARATSIRRSAGGHATHALPVIERVVEVVERTDIGSTRVFDVEVPTELTVPLAGTDLAELLGALIENAARYSRRRVRVSGSAMPSPCLTVCDDGPGLGSGRAEDVLARGGRLDEATPGHGLGLSIARDLAHASGATLSFDRGVLGGLEVSVRWPA
jgi:signal transduction histidine kinase